MQPINFFRLHYVKIYVCLFTFFSKKNTKRQILYPTGLYELFLLTVPIEEVACWRYKSVLILSVITSGQSHIDLDVV